MKILPIIFLFLFSVAFPSYIFSKGIEVANTKSGSSTWYNGSTCVFKNNEFANYWELNNHVREKQ
jgi:hypothetical protein